MCRDKKVKESEPVTTKLTHNHLSPNIEESNKKQILEI